MGQGLLWLRLHGLSFTVLYERGRRQQMPVPAPNSGRLQRWKEIPKAEDGVEHKQDKEG